VVFGGSFINVKDAEKVAQAYLRSVLHGQQVGSKIPGLAWVQSIQRILYCVMRHWNAGEGEKQGISFSRGEDSVHSSPHKDLIGAGLSITDWDDVRGILTLVHLHQTQIVLNDVLSGLDTSLPMEDRKRLLEDWQKTVEVGACLRRTLKHKLRLEKKERVWSGFSFDVNDFWWEEIDWSEFNVVGVACVRLSVFKKALTSETQRDLAHQFAALNAYVTLADRQGLDPSDRWELLGTKTRAYLKMLASNTLKSPLEIFEELFETYKADRLENMNLTRSIDPSEYQVIRRAENR
jgi:hypothetical protein